MVSYSVTRRLAFADAEDLQKKIESQRSRISILEAGLKALQASISDEPHPLLAADEGVIDASRVLAGGRHGAESITGPPLTREDEEFLDAFGVASRRLLLLDIKLTHTHTRQAPLRLGFAESPASLAQLRGQRYEWPLPNV